MQDKKILVADDESHILHVVSLKLRNAGYGVITAQDGREAFELAQNDKPDLLITDLNMPQMSGIELLTAMRSHPATMHIPAIMLTARGYDLVEGEMERCGILRMLSKPFSPRELLAAVNDILEHTAV